MSAAVQRSPGAPTYVSGSRTISVPASSANLGPGFDALGLALGLRDEIVVEVQPGGVEVTVTGQGAGTVALDDTHLVVAAMLETFAALGLRPPGLSLRCTNRIPHGRGLGSSAAAIVAGVVGARSLVADGERLLDDAAVYALATRIEGHPDNVAAALHGGFTIAWGDPAAPRVLRLDPAPGLVAVSYVPAAEVSTRAARGLLPARVAHADAAVNAGRAALLVAALTTRPDLLLDATHDLLHQQYRAPAMPASAALVVRLRAAGIAALLSGSGPTVLALVEGRDAPVAAALAPADFATAVLAVDPRGAQVVPAAAAAAGR